MVSWVIYAGAIAVIAIYFALDKENYVLSNVTLKVLGINPTTWHEGESWARVLDVYDQRVEEHFGHCTSRVIPTTFGNTHAIDCSSKINLPVVLYFHGARATATSWAYQLNDPELRENFRLVAIDYICDVGRSQPKVCPSKKGDHGQWVKEIMDYIGAESAHFVGYSYGSFVSAVVGIEAPELSKGKHVILNAPAAIFAPITVGFWYHVLMSAIFKNYMGFGVKWMWTWMVSPNYDMDNEQFEREMQFQIAIDAVNYEYVISMMPYQFSNAELQMLKLNTKTLTPIMPEFETVTKPEEAIKHAEANGVEAVIVKDCGHAMLFEKTQENSKVVKQRLLER